MVALNRYLSFVPSYRGYWVVVLLLMVAYFLKSAGIGFFGGDSVIAAWVLVASLVVPFYRRKAVVCVAVVYFWLLAWFALGLARMGDMGGNDALVRIFPSFFLLSAITALFLNGRDRISQNAALLPEVAVLLLLLWAAFFIYQEQANVSYAVREYGVTNYLTLADLVAMLTLVTVFGRSLPPLVRGGWILVGVLACMLIGSRATMVLVAFSLILGMLIGSNGGVVARAKYVAMAAAVLALAITTFISRFDETITYRFMTLVDMSGDESAQGRNDFLLSYVDSVSNDASCLFFPCMPSAGQYVHNILSVPQYFGIGGIIFLIASIAALLLAFMKGWRPFAFPLFVFCILELMLARAWVSLVFPVAVGYVVSAMIFLGSQTKIILGGDRRVH